MATLTEVANALLKDARSNERGRSAELLVHDGPLRQTVIALRQGTTLAEHNSPPAASMQVLSGSVRVTGEQTSTIAAGELVALTHARHGVEALEDASFLLTTVTSVPGAESHGAPARD